MVQILKKTVTLDRRDFLISSLAAGTLLALPSHLVAANPLNGAIRLFTGIPTVDPGGLRNPKQTGTLSNDEASTLFDLYQFVVQTWGMSSHIEGKNKSSFESLLGSKTKQEPSYLTEYQAASKILQTAIAKSGNKEEAFAILLASRNKEPGGAESEKIELARFYKFVLDEFIRYMVTIDGGFRVITPYVNYNGYIRGIHFADFSDQDNVPYRPYKKASPA